MIFKRKKITKIVIIGAGYAYWEIFDLISDINKFKYQYEIVAIIDDSYELIGKVFNNITIKGPIMTEINTFSEDIKFVFAIGSVKSRLNRKKIIKNLNLNPNRFVTLIHPTVKIYSNTKIGYGCIIHYGSIILSQSIIENFTLISACCVIGVKNLIGEGCLFASSITTATDIQIGSYSFIGAGVIIAPNIEIGPGSMIGLGSCVFRNTLSGEFTLGNPSRVINKEEVEKEIIELWENSKTSYNLNFKK